jgi:hypothetical protein
MAVAHSLGVDPWAGFPSGIKQPKRRQQMKKPFVERLASGFWWIRETDNASATLATVLCPALGSAGGTSTAAPSVNRGRREKFNGRKAHRKIHRLPQMLTWMSCRGRSEL